MSFDLVYKITDGAQAGGRQGYRLLAAKKQLFRILPNSAQNQNLVNRVTIDWDHKQI